MKKLTIPLVLGFALAAGSAQATRVLEVLERSYELALSDVTVPQVSTGNVGFKPCDTCAYKYMSVSGTTLYYVGSQMATLATFSEEVARIRRMSGQSDRTLVMLRYDPKTEVATRISVATP